MQTCKHANMQLSLKCSNKRKTLIFSRTGLFSGFKDRRLVNTGSNLLALNLKNNCTAEETVHCIKLHNLILLNFELTMMPVY